MVEKKSSKTSPNYSKAEVKAPRESGYVLFCKTARHEVKKDFPSISYSDITRVASERWAALTTRDKIIWNKKAAKQARLKALASAKDEKKLERKIKLRNIQTKKKLQMRSLEKRKEPQTSRVKSMTAETKETPSPESFEPPKDVDYSEIGIPASLATKLSRPVSLLDSAAHLKLLGESLSVIGTRLTTSTTPLAVQGSLSVLMDSLLCATTPLIALTAEIPELHDEDASQEFGQMMENLTYIMPGM